MMSDAIMKKYLQYANSIENSRAGFSCAYLRTLTQLDEGPAPFPAFAAFLRQIAAGQPAPIPGGLPDELREWLEKTLMQAPS
jgi:hypothetical protein